MTDPGRSFDIGALLAELDAIEKVMSPGDVKTWGEMNFIRGVIHLRLGKLDEALAYSKIAASMSFDQPFLSSDEHSFLFSNLASRAESAKRWQLAAEAYTSLIAFFDTNSPCPEARRLQASESLAICLRNAGQREEALRTMDETVRRAERALAPDIAEMLLLLARSGQFAFDLDDFEAVRRYQERRRALATQHDQAAHLDDSLYRLAVVSMCTGMPQEADDLMVLRVCLAQESHDDSRIATAKRDLLMSRHLGLS
ncbi:hypothetical protein [Rhizobium sp. Root1220]|uniref:hypothetical protein n=1 Tax=Rhizobium sp. Root1220 TaxID=1736432 RepID=UPI0012E3EC1F|nr:hypothetical protein [Rhizobium sp. Root1220]